MAAFALAMPVFTWAEGAASAPSTIPFKSSSASDAAGADLTWALIVCLALLAVAVLVLRRWGPKAGLGIARVRSVKVVETARLGPKAALAVVHYRGREMLIAHSEQAVSLIASQPIESSSQEAA